MVIILFIFEWHP